MVTSGIPSHAAALDSARDSTNFFSQVEELGDRL
jgi:hypothetical protein